MPVSWPIEHGPGTHSDLCQVYQIEKINGELVEMQKKLAPVIQNAQETSGQNAPE